MFSFLRKRREQAEARATEEVLAACETELQRTVRANWSFMTAPRDIATRTELLERARAAGRADAEVVQKLAFFHRLLSALREAPNLASVDALLAEARQLGVGEGDALRKLVAVAESAMLAEQGLRPMEQDAQGRAVYLRCNAEFKNKPGQLEIRDDGVCFRDEVLVEIPWSNVLHAAETSHTYQGLDYAAVAIQEGKRRTPTKFAFPLYDHGAIHACKVALAAWEKRGQQPTSEPIALPQSETPPRQPATGAEPWTGYGYLAAVGESQYQEALTRVAQSGRVCEATLIPEPRNPFDSNAVSVQIDGATVGYLCRADARRYQRRLLALPEPMKVPRS